MVVISYSLLRNYVNAKPDIRAALEDWYFKTKAAEWKNIAELRQTVNTVDFVGNDRFVFNIKGNSYSVRRLKNIIATKR